ncbi:hypothetical protein B9Z65_2887 [Elsinoe australis]|uniref:Extracellular membrane protein CFEM domain-containing protein n=1 Tax=Elsinoe australis TaxID=40998 RepID=A0A2P7ZTR9_9PEZI|nr:hypothetical protein B9Z65_2887 [Elsinoe australis]
MKSGTILSTSALLFASSTLAQRGPYQNGGPNGGQPGGLNGPSCLSNCTNDLGGVNWAQGGLTSLCGNGTAVDTVNSCVADSDCSDSDKQSTYQVIAQICANAGSPVSASPEATYSATSGGTNYPTGTGSWASYASMFSTLTGAPSAVPTGAGGWGPGSGHGPFGAGGPGNGYGPWGSNSGSWTNGPWTSWWGGSACPPSTWSGWTSGSWSSNAPWTTWTACTASTTSTGVVTTTVTTGGTTRAATSTNFGLQLAQASTSPSSTGASGSTGGSELSKDVSFMGVAGAGLASLLITVFGL